jgi:hypothetical protein
VQQMDAGKPKVLIQIISAGQDPWMSIEKGIQEQVLVEQLIPEVEIHWLEGDPRMSKRPFYWLLNLIMKFWHTSFHWPLVKIDVRRTKAVTFVFWFLNTVTRRYRHRFKMPILWFLDLRAWRIRNFQKPGPEPSVNRWLRHVFSDSTFEFKRVAKYRVRVCFPNSYFLAPYRTVLGLKYALENYEFDYLVRTISTSYVRLNRMVQTLADLPRRRVYAGPVLDLAGVSFVSGGAMVLSRDVVQGIVDNWQLLRLDVFDDVGLGRLVSECDLGDALPLGQVEVRFSNQSLESKPPGWDDEFMFRCKAQRITTSSEPAIDLMRSVHRLFS